jgi:hypothetical protein
LITGIFPGEKKTLPLKGNVPTLVRQLYTGKGRTGFSRVS